MVNSATDEQPLAAGAGHFLQHHLQPLRAMRAIAEEEESRDHAQGEIKHTASELGAESE